MSVLVDTSVWVDYFRGAGQTEGVDRLIEENLVVTNDLILAELIPPLLQRKEKSLVALLREIKTHPVAIDWADIIQMQITCLQNGINGVGIPDLIIAQNAIQNHLQLLAYDKHFALMSEHMPLSMHGLAC
jgi:predicted nucleic acid-binding protein